jgi:hypothetical protein
VQARECAQERGLAAAVGAHEGGDLPGPDAGAGRVDDLDAVVAEIEVGAAERCGGSPGREHG